MRPVSWRKGAGSGRGLPPTIFQKIRAPPHRPHGVTRVKKKRATAGPFHEGKRAKKPAAHRPFFPWPRPAAGGPVAGGPGPSPEHRTGAFLRQVALPGRKTLRSPCPGRVELARRRRGLRQPRKGGRRLVLARRASIAQAIPRQRAANHSACRRVAPHGPAGRRMGRARRKGVAGRTCGGRTGPQILVFLQIALKGGKSYSGPSFRLRVWDFEERE